MYFIPRNNKFYSTFVGIPIIIRYGLSLLCISILVGLWYRCLYQKCDIAMHVMKLHAQELKKQLRLLDQKHTEVEQLRKQVDQKEKKYINMQQRFFKQQEAIPSYIFSQAQKSTVSLIYYVPKKEIHKEWYSKVPYQIACIGNFSSIVSFCDKLNKESSMYCTDLNVQKSNNGQVHATCIVEHLKNEKSS